MDFLPETKPASLAPKNGMVGNRRAFPIGVKGLFSGANLLLVSGSVLFFRYFFVKPNLISATYFVAKK